MPDSMLEKLNQPIFEIVTRRDVAVFSRQLSLLLDCGMPLLKSLRVLSQRTTNMRFSKVIQEIGDQVEQGNTFATALSNYPRYFSDLYINIVRVGEVGGSLEQALRRLAEFTDRDLRYRNKLMYAMLYPAILLVTAVVIICLILIYVLPVFLDLFKESGAKLPVLTQIMATLGDFMSDWWPLVIIIIAVLIALFFWLRKTPFGRKGLDYMKLHTGLPVAGKLGQKILVARMAETLSLLLKSGIQLIPAIRVTASASGNVIVEESLSAAADEVEQGRSFQEILSKQQILPPMVVDMIGVGEEAGSLDSVLDRIYEDYSEETELALESVNRIVEPVLIVLFGGFALLIALSVYQAYWSVGRAIE